MAAVTATIGASGDYATWAALVADITNVVSASDDLTVELIDNAVYDETFDFSSIYSTVAVTSIVLTAGASARHDGTAGSGARIIRSANGAQNAAIVQFEDDCACTIEDLEVSAADGFGWDRLVSGGTGGSPTGTGVVQRCILHDNRGRSANTAHSYGIFTGKAGFVAQNNIIYNITHGRTGIDIYGICQLTGTTATNAEVFNNTVYNIGSATADAVHGIFLSSATSPDVVRNNLVIGLTAGTGSVTCFQVASASVSYNASSDSTATGTGSLTSRAAGTEFRDTTSGSENLLLSASSTVYEQGLDIGTSPTGVNLDILRRDRDSEGDTWSIGASQLTDAAVNAITLTSPQSYQILQHTSGTASLTVSGTFTGTPTAIEYRYNGGSWTTLDAAPTGGAFSESITLNRGEQGTLEVRFTNDTDASASATFVGCGEVFAIFGQSNASGRGTNNRTYSHATLKVGQYTGNGWQEMADPIDANANVLDSVADDTSTPGGHWAHKMCTDLMAGLDVPVGVLVVAKGGTGITSFLPGVDHLDRTTLYGSLNFHCNAVGGVKAVLWWQGETDAIAAMTQATYNGHLDTIANALQTDRGVKLVACLLQNSSGITDGDEQAIRDAVTEAVGDNANVLEGPDFSAIASDDSFHLQTNTKVDNAGASWATSIFAELLPTVTLTEPSSITLTGEVETLQWTTLGVTSVDVELSTDGGSNYTAIDSANAGTSYAWTPEASQLSSDARIRVVDASDASVSDVSGAFKVATTSTGVPTDSPEWNMLRQVATDAGLELTQ